MVKEAIPPYLILEAANVHAGDIGYLESLIHKFSEVKYQRKGIKFQIFSPDGISLPDFEWYPVYKKLFFEEDIWSKLIEKSACHGGVWIDIFDSYGVKILEDNLSKIFGIKLQASVLENYEIRNALKNINLADKQLIINVSGLDLNDVQPAYDFFSKISKNIIIQIGYQGYPTKVSDTALQKIPVLLAAFPNVPICMADHADAELSFAVSVPVYAALLGCSYIEKHFCLDRKAAEYDGFSSLEFSQVADLCVALEDAFYAAHGPFISDAEAEYLRKTIQIPVLHQEKKTGDLISLPDLVYRRTSQSGINSRQIIDAQRQGSILAVAKSANSTIQLGDYRKAHVAAIVACRMKSSRLPRKAILSIAGVSSVERCLHQCMGIQGVERVVLATSNLESDKVLKQYTLAGNVDFWQGDADDVISRYLGACESFGVDVVVRVTADCPLVLPEIIEYLLKKHFESGADYTAAKEAAVGSTGEIINVQALRKVFQYFKGAEYSEYMTWYFQNNPDVFDINIVELPPDLVRNYRMTLDYKEDLMMFELLYGKMNKKSNVYSSKDVFSVLDNNPDIAEINAHLTLKYRTDKNLIDMLNSKTRMISKV